MIIILAFCIINSGLVSLCFFIIAEQKKQGKFCKNVQELYDNFLTHKEKYTYFPLSKSTANEKIILLNLNKRKKLFCEKFLYKNIDLLYTISKFIDYKINSNNFLYRAKNGKILIEQIASTVAFSAIISDKCKLFSLYKKLNLQYNLRVKENKIFKLLLGQQLIYLLFEIEHETIEISKIIDKSKNFKKVKNYKKKLYYLAELYAIKKFHKNSTKLLSNYKYNYSKIANNLLLELDDISKKQKIIISYIITMFA